MKDGLSARPPFEKAFDRLIFWKEQSTDPAKKEMAAVDKKRLLDLKHIQRKENKAISRVKLRQKESREEDMMKARVKVMQPKLKPDSMGHSPNQVEKKAEALVNRNNKLEEQSVHKKFTLDRKTAEKWHKQETEKILRQDEKSRSKGAGRSGHSDNQDRGR